MATGRVAGFRVEEMPEGWTWVEMDVETEDGTARLGWSLDRRAGLRMLEVLASGGRLEAGTAGWVA